VGRGEALADTQDGQISVEEETHATASPGWWKGLGKALIGVLCLAVAGGVVYGMWGGSSPNRAAATSGETTASVSKGSGGRAGSGFPLPRFVSLKADRVNVRRGPSSEHQVSWVFTRKGLPVEIVAESDHWRRIRDSEGAEGWVYHSLLAGRRTAVVAPWSEGKTVPLRDGASQQAHPVALLQSGVMGDVEACDGSWCRVTVDGREGWVEQETLWGVYPGERVEE
jgi:SH3-like domain-containing protein